MAIKAGFVNNLPKSSEYHQSISDFYFLTYCF
jgi:hypothetical protein